MLTNTKSPLGPLAQKSLLGRHRAAAGEASSAPAQTAVLDPPGQPRPQNAVACEQGIFTSTHSATGEGYRLIAVSPGITVEERQEVTRCSPSHGSLLLGPGLSHGLLAYPLSSGRYCVSCCCHAGVEQSARGGQRVYTQFVLLDAGFVERMHANPLPVHRFLCNLIQHAGPQLRPPAFLEPLLVPATAGENELWQRPGHIGATVPNGNDRSERPWIWPVLAELLLGRSVVLAGSCNLWTLLSRTLLCMPRAARAALSIAVGLRYAPARRSNLTLTPTADAGATAFAGEELRIWSTTQTMPPIPVAAQPWCQWAQRWCDEGYYEGIAKLTHGPLATASAETLSKLAGLCEDLCRARRDANCNKAAMRMRYEAVEPASEEEAGLLAQLREATAPEQPADGEQPLSR